MSFPVCVCVFDEAIERLGVGGADMEKEMKHIAAISLSVSPVLPGSPALSHAHDYHCYCFLF